MKSKLQRTLGQIIKVQFYLQFCWTELEDKHLYWRDNICNIHSSVWIGAICITYWKYAGNP